MSDKSPVILLYDLFSAGIILSYESGVTYANQCGGYSCLERGVEGILIPIDFEDKRLNNTLLEYFTNDHKWKGCCDNGIDIETADFIDDLMSESYRTEMLVVNREKLMDSCEAWVHMNIDSSKVHDSSKYIKGIKITDNFKVLDTMLNFQLPHQSIPCVLTWNNSG